MERQTGYTVTIRAAVTKQLSVSAMTAKDAERIAHGMFTMDEVDSRNVVQETVGSIVECRELDCTKRYMKPWAIVDNAGMEDEILFEEFATFELALKCKRKRPGADIMKRNASHLTTEY